MSSDVKHPSCATHDEEEHTSLDVFLEDPSLSEGQRKRLALLRSVEATVCTRVEELCSSEDIDVMDVAVLVIDASASELFFQDEPCDTTILIGHRLEVRGYLRSMLPAADDAPFDPYDDLLTPAPSQSVRVFIMDRESLTVLSYGTFVSVRIDPDEMLQA